MKIHIKLLIILLFAISCKAQDKEQLDPLVYCSDAIFVNNLQINTICNKRTPEAYSIPEIKSVFSIPIVKEINKPVDEDTGGGNETYWDLVFKDHLGKVSFEVYDKKIPEIYITNPSVLVKLGVHTFKVGDTVTKLKNALNTKGFNNDEDKELFIYFDFNVLAFGIEDGKIKYISFSGNYFF